MFLSVDPGNSVGLATFEEDGSDIKKLEVTLDHFPIFLQGVIAYSQKSKEMVRFIYEDFTLRQDKAIAQTGSDMPASQAIGMIKMAHAILGEKSLIFKVSPSNLRTALKWAGRPDLANKPRTWHCPNDMSAYAHGVMWLIQNNVRKHPLFES